MSQLYRVLDKIQILVNKLAFRIDSRLIWQFVTLYFEKGTLYKRMCHYVAPNAHRIYLMYTLFHRS